MLDNYAYLIGVLVTGFIFCLIFAARRDLRKAMVFSGLFYAAILTAAFFMLLLFVSRTDSPRSITPGYWTPPTLFNLGHRTGGYAIEDVLFMFFNGGIAAALYELVYNLKINKKGNKKLKKGYALLAGIAGAYLVLVFTSLNAIYLLIAFQFFGALALIGQRRDLLKHSIAGGLLFLVFYGSLFLVFNRLFPSFIPNYYHVRQTSHVWFLGLPLEEYLYGFSFGLLWAPLYEYEFKLGDSKRKSKTAGSRKARSLGPRRFLMAAAAAKR